MDWKSCVDFRHDSVRGKSEVRRHFSFHVNVLVANLVANKGTPGDCRGHQLCYASATY